jgi:hypothetical protein
VRECRGSERKRSKGASRLEEKREQKDGATQDSTAQTTETDNRIG